MDFKRIVFGSPIPNHQAEKNKLKIFPAIAIFSSNALSSVAYATGEIFLALSTLGTFAISAYAMPIAIAVVILAIIVGLSYRQTIKAYPNGGGAYIVAKENFGKQSGLITAASLLVDYTLTVSVSISTAILAIVSAIPELASHKVFLAIFLISMLTWANIRGIRKTATILMWPTYAFIVIIFIMLAVGIFRYISGDLDTSRYIQESLVDLPKLTSLLTITIILRAFSSGCSAMTGIEAVANGTPVFSKPSVKNATKTLSVLIFLLVVMFSGITFLAMKLYISPIEHQSLLSQLGHNIFGGGFFYYFLQASTFFILFLAANTAFAGFPRLVSVISKDGFLPKQLKNVGDRLAFRNGIVLLAILASLLIVIFDASIGKLIPLYSFGVFVAFTFCQAGLVKFWYKNRKTTRNWILKSFLNSLGGVATAVAVLIIVESKFLEGAWIVAVAIPLIIYFFIIVKKHYTRVELSLGFRINKANVESLLKKKHKEKVIVLVSKIHKGTIEALDFARNISSDVTPVTVSLDDEDTRQTIKMWKKLGFKERLIVVKPIYNSLVSPVLEVIRNNDLREPKDNLSVIIMSEVVNTKWWHFILHNQNPSILRLAITAMDKKEHIGSSRVIINVPYKIPVG